MGLNCQRIIRSQHSDQSHQLSPSTTDLHPNAMTQDLLYLDDMQVGQKFISGAYEMTGERIKTFAAEFDPQPFHLDEAAAQTSVFRFIRT